MIGQNVACRVPTSKATHTAIHQRTRYSRLPFRQRQHQRTCPRAPRRGCYTFHYFNVLGTSLEAIRVLQAKRWKSPKYYPEDREFLLEFEPSVMH